MHRMVWNLRGLFNLVLQAECPLCQRSTTEDFCLDCQRQVQRCQLRYAHPLPTEQSAVFAWGAYSGGLKRAIAAFKYENQSHLARPLGHWLAQSWLTHHSATKQLTIVPIPLHASKQKQRGFNQAELLAQYFCEVTGLPLASQGLVRSQETTSQFKLSALERQQNLIDAFQIGPPFRHKLPAYPVVLLDDIYTTGATIQSATQVLRRAGMRVAGAIVLARALQEKQRLD